MNWRVVDLERRVSELQRENDQLRAEVLKIQTTAFYDGIMAERDRIATQVEALPDNNGWGWRGRVLAVVRGVAGEGE